MPVSVRPEDRRDYLDTLRQAQMAQDDSAPAFQAFMHQRLVASLEQHITDLGGRALGISDGDLAFFTT